MTEPAELPTILVKPPQHEVNDQALLALKARASELGMYKRGGRLVRVEREDGEQPEGIERPPEAPVIRMVGRATLRHDLTRIAHWVQPKRVLKDGTVITEPCHPPEWTVDKLMEATDWPVPRLEGVVEAPVLLRSGEVLQRPGYDRFSGLFYAPPAGAKFLPVPEEPTEEDIAVALSWLNEAVFDFPFEQPHHRAAWKAGVLSYFARWAYAGHTPFLLVDGNVRGSGKGKLATAAATICLGRKPMLAHQTNDDKEEKELITAVAMSGEMMVVIDNIARPFGSAPLDSALTEEFWCPVLKYKNEPSRFPLRAIWWGTGNNVQFRKASDIVRRTLKIRIESPLQNPESRQNFKRPEPHYSAWLRANRRHFVWAALTLLRGFWVAKPQTDGKILGSFEGWSRLVRDTLVWAGDEDPLKAAAEQEDGADPLVEALGDFLRGWRELAADLNAEYVTADEALQQIQCDLEYKRTNSGHKTRYDGLIGAIHDLKPGLGNRLPTKTELGIMLRNHKTRVVDGMSFDYKKLPGNRRSWRVKVREGKRAEGAEG